MLKKVMITILLITLCASTGFAQGGAGKGMDQEIPRGKWWQNSEIAAQMNLTADEIEKLNTAYTQMRRKLIRLQSDVKLQRFELENVLESRNMNADAVMKQFDTLEKARTDMSREIFLFIVEVREILGLDRYTELKNNYKQFRRDRIRGKIDRARNRDKAQ